MKTPIELNNDLVKYVEESASRTEKIVGAKVSKRGNVKKLSDITRPNIKVPINVIDAGIIEVQFIYRDALRLRDMGAGRGYSKGRANSVSSLTGRRPVKITNRPIHAQINRLSEVVDGAFHDFTVQELIPANLIKANLNGK